MDVRALLGGDGNGFRDPLRRRRTRRLPDLGRDAFRIEVTYDPDTGMPLDFFIDCEENVAEEELGFRVNELPHS